MTELKGHNTRVSIVKGMAISLMVVGHSDCHEWLSHWIYMFHMPVFFFVSGYLLDDRHLDKPWEFIRRKVKGLWWPFVKWSLIFLAMHNLFASLHIYDNVYSLSDFATRVVRILTLTTIEQIVGGFWFLKVLLYASVVSFFSLRVLRKIPFAAKSDGVGRWLVPLFLVVALLLTLVPVKQVVLMGKICLASAFYMTGYSCRRTRIESFANVGIAAVLLAMVGVVSVWFHDTMDVHGVRLFAYYIVAMAGVLGLWGLSGCMYGYFGRVFDFVGEKTMPVFVFHFLSFKIVSLVMIKVCGLPIGRLSDFPVIRGEHWLWSVCYVVAGIAVPLLLDMTGKSVYGVWKRKIG